MASAEGSLKFVATGPTGVGVAGMAAATLDKEATGAGGGAAGVAVFVVCTGVEGALAGVDELDAAGAALGYIISTRL